MEKHSLKTASDSIKQTLANSDWWKFVQSEVRDQLFMIADNLGAMGIPFRDSFVHAFRYAHCRRLIEHEAVERKSPGSLFGRALPEEVYQSGILPTKMLLNLNDWIVPNEADVQSCMHVCTQVDVFETIGSIGGGEELPNSLDFFEKP